MLKDIITVVNIDPGYIKGRIERNELQDVVVEDNNKTSIIRFNDECFMSTVVDVCRILVNTGISFKYDFEERS